MSKKKNIIPQFLKESPCGEDLFESKSQESIADSICDLITEDSTEINHIIGLDGGWGTGKSNIVKILNKKLKETHRIFIYDAWGHQEDLHRRSFLENLISYLCKEKLIQKNTWNNKLKNLLSLKRETETKTIPRLSVGIVTTILIFLITPIASQISDKIDTENVWLGLYISSIPLLFGFLWWFLLCFVNREGEDTFKVWKWDFGWYPIGVKDIYHLYNEHELSRTTNLLISEKEPSVREFKSWMESLSKALGTKKVVIVFDNMDRVDNLKVTKLWSSIHTFFSEESYKNIWTIIPFDRKQLQSKDISVRKTFSIIFRVPPPVLSDWKNFFDLKFNDAFSKEEESEKIMVKNIFNLCSKTIKPRDIIFFINELVATRRTSPEGVKLRYMAVFVLKKSEIMESPSEKILNLDFIRGLESIFTNDNNLQDAIASLTYGIPLDRATQVTLSRSVELAFREENVDKIQNLSKNPHFIQMLEDVLFSNTNNFSKWIRSLNSVDMSLFKDNENLLNEMWEYLYKGQIKSREQEPIQLRKEDTILLSNIENKKKKKYCRFLLQNSTKENNNISGNEYYQLVKDIENEVIKNKYDINIYDQLKEIYTAPSEFMKLVGLAKTMYEKFKVVTNNDELCTYLFKNIEVSDIHFETLTYLKNDYDFSTLEDDIKNLIKTDNLSNQNCKNIFLTLKSLSTDKPINVEIDDSVINDLLINSEENSEEYYDLVCLRIEKGDSFPNYGTFSYTIVNDHDDELVKQISRRIEYFINYGDLLLKVKAWNKPLITSVLENLTSNSYGVSRANINKILQEYELIFNSLNISPEILLKNLDGWSKHLQLSAEEIEEQIPDEIFFEHACIVKNTLTKKTLNTFKEHAEALSVDDWKSALTNEESYQLNVTIILLKQQEIKRLYDNLQKAYREVLESIAKKEILVERNDLWKILYEKMDKRKIRTTAKDIRDYFISTTDIDSLLFLFFFEILTKYGDLSVKRCSDDVVRRILNPVLDNEECFNLMLTKADLIAKIVNNAKDSSVDFKDKVKENYDLNTDEEKSFAKMIDLNLDEEEE